MIADHLTGIENSDADLRKIADESVAPIPEFASNDYFMLADWVSVLRPRDEPLP